MDNTTERVVDVLMLPWLDHDHANCYLELAKNLTREQDNLYVQICSTGIILESLRDNLQRRSMVTSCLRQLPPETRINLVEILIPEQAELPPHMHSTEHLPASLVPALKQAFAQSEQIFALLLDTLKPDFLIFDIFQPWAAKLARQHNIPTAVYIGSTFAMSSCAHDYFVHSKVAPFLEIKQTPETLGHQTESAQDQKGYRHFVEQGALCWQLSDFVIARSFREIESKYIDYLSSLIGKEVFLTGPLISDVSSISQGKSQETEYVIRWLNQRERRSVVFVSLSSQCFMPYNKIEQIARGLELSGAPFIWVAHFPENNEMAKHSNLEETDKMLVTTLLHRLVEKVGPERGLLVTSWVPQHDILLHRNLGGFITHCGWSSVLEGIQAGVPMLGLPMESDQQLHAKLTVELGIGVEIPQRDLGNFKGEDVAACIETVLHSEHGERVWKNSQKLAKVIHNRKDDETRILANKIVGLVSSEPIEVPLLVTCQIIDQ